ncbi:glycerate dehydrogenase [Gracilibacillus salitolerans]|uniref:Glycerate dehydrogenase n=1 Tax=Gracilibacillus salitolerans TaxID=2663022 RepID=A0A5Q2TKU2_9BACI|nr:hydroxyacid dehydrogenase [Gracilibacillus salitolerans]QGH35574.1 glycerate dehydrogenase [Gracilibacillus salitolerans]
MKAMYIMSDKSFDLVYPPKIRQEIESLVEVMEPLLTPAMLQEDYTVLNDIDVILSGWGGPRIDHRLLQHAPQLKAVFYAAGSLKKMVTDEMWDKNIIITNAVHANAVPVMEFTVSQILFCLKNGWQFVRDIQRDKIYPSKPYDIFGSFGSTVGIISLSTIGKGVCELLKQFDLKVIAYDPFANQEEAKELGVELCDLEDIFQLSDIVSLHTPLLEETRGLITGEHFQMLKPNACFINTARGAIVKENEMIQVLNQRQDITAILDVTDPEPPDQNSLLYYLPNIVLTPHLAGSQGAECARMGYYMFLELERYVNNRPLQWQVFREEFQRQA